MKRPASPGSLAASPLFVLVLLLLLSSLAAVGTPAQRRKKASGPEVERFHGSLEEARQAARERNVPVALFAILDEERDNQAFREILLEDKALQRAFAGVLLIITNNGKHERAKITEKDEEGNDVEREVCAQYGTDYCADHQRAWNEFYQSFQEEDGSLNLPQTVVLMPDWSVAFRDNSSHYPDVKTISDELRKALRVAGPGLTREALAEVKLLADEGRTMTRAKSFGDAWRAWAGVLAIHKQGAYADEARESMPATEAGMRGDLAKACELLKPGSAPEGYRKLHALLRDFAGTPVEGEVKKAMRGAEKDPEIGEEVAACKLELEAEDLLESVLAFLDEGDEVQAKRALRRLLVKKYEGTEAAKRARELDL